MSRSTTKRASNRGSAKRAANRTVNKGQANSKSTSTKSRSGNSLIRYLRDTRAEISKVTWPTREEGTRLTIIVMISTIISAFALFGVDTLFSLIITNLLGVF